jgi:hypothetical protein
LAGTDLITTQIAPSSGVSSHPTPSEPAPEPLRIRDRLFRPTVVFNTYWRFAATRQAIYLARLRRSATPPKQDEILRNHRFTNVFRASDRVSQFLISSVQSGPACSGEAADIVFRTLFFKIFNRQDTWRHVESRVGAIQWSTYGSEGWGFESLRARQKGQVKGNDYLAVLTSTAAPSTRPWARSRSAWSA